MLRWIGWIIVGVIIVFLCGLLSALPLTSFIENNLLAPFGVQTGADAQRALERQFSISFPGGVADYRRASWGDRAYWLQFKTNPQNLSAIFRGSPYMTCQFPLVDNFRPVFEFDRILNAQQRLRMDWWNPASARSHTGGECTGTDYKIFRMFADTTNPELWTFYMEVVRT